ncbi:SSU ribosomal protein S12P methylthiotransferase [Isosphaera pallida ATCC 43644]|uniref:Ribosomal protein uS12 methylthiotransferase RimO n=1 Tax=Isosphaera pallida (strain ATCC 43644 / DSM 9630 / IS1B) TaxID=575540 RepID=E8R3H0_ISOPI|nr:30S ribosomal protein S12 methylthiotransferase RimO [Isosphaera pallida]ADV61537.1 SSU ribosomal protein S12P methylthiotransferase [Isosphaera pallida ATCC 43644]
MKSDALNPIKGTFSFVTLGCAKNLVDSERMLGLLSQDGYALVPEGEPCDLVIVNTCGFIEPARKESMAVIHELLDRKRAGTVKGVIVAGCLAERNREELLDQVPEIDQVIGVFGREQIVQAADRVLGGLVEQRTIFNPAPIQAQIDRARLRVTPRHLAYLKVSEGCDRLCTFCAIPMMRGKHVTKPIEEVLREAEELVRDGVRELVLVAQDMTYYGMDLYGEPRLAELLQRLDQLDGLDWIRILYCYPRHFTDELYATLAGATRIVPYLDMPLQHINDRMLRAMNRRHTKQETIGIIQRLRAEIPRLVLRTTFIVGFPGETEEQFAELEEFVVQTRFERLGVFPYSYEPDTPAARLKGHLDEETKLQRRDRIMAAQQPIAFEFNESLVGQTLEVLIDAADLHPRHEGDPFGPDGQPHRWIGRTYADAPDVDGLTLVSGSGLRPGDLVECRIVAARGYDLEARPTGRPPRRRKLRPRAARGRGASLPILS